MSNRDPKKISEPPVRGQSLLSVFGSVLASMFGVQSGRKHEQDFTKGHPWVYVTVGLIMTVAFIMTIWFVVQLVLKSAGV